MQCHTLSLYSYISWFLLGFQNFAVLLRHKRSQQIDSILEADPPTKRLRSQPQPRILADSSRRASWDLRKVWGFPHPETVRSKLLEEKNTSHRSWGKLGNFGVGGWTL